MMQEVGVPMDQGGSNGGGGAEPMGELAKEGVGKGFPLGKRNERFSFNPAEGEANIVDRRTPKGSWRARHYNLSSRALVFGNDIRFTGRNRGLWVIEIRRRHQVLCSIAHQRRQRFNAAAAASKMAPVIDLVELHWNGSACSPRARLDGMKVSFAVVGLVLVPGHSRNPTLFSAFQPGNTAQASRNGFGAADAHPVRASDVMGIAGHAVSRRTSREDGRAPRSRACVQEAFKHHHAGPLRRITKSQLRSASNRAAWPWRDLSLPRQGEGLGTGRNAATTRGVIADSAPPQTNGIRPGRAGSGDRQSARWRWSRRQQAGEARAGPLGADGDGGQTRPPCFGIIIGTARTG